MRAVVQRVCEASVTVDNEVIGSIKNGLLVFAGIIKGDNESDCRYIASKLGGLRFFEDEHGKMNLSVKDACGEVLLVSQFTLPGDARKGRRPSFARAMDPEEANSLFENFINMVESEGIKVATGQFQSCMKVNLINDGPVTIILDSKKEF